MFFHRSKVYVSIKNVHLPADIIIEPHIIQAERGALLQLLPSCNR